MKKFCITIALIGCMRAVERPSQTVTGWEVKAWAVYSSGQVSSIAEARLAVPDSWWSLHVRRLEDFANPGVVVQVTRKTTIAAIQAALQSYPHMRGSVLGIYELRPWWLCCLRPRRLTWCTDEGQSLEDLARRYPSGRLFVSRAGLSPSLKD